MKYYSTTSQNRTKNAVKMAALTTFVALGSLFTGVKIGQEKERDKFRDLLVKEFFQNQKLEDDIANIRTDMTELEQRNASLINYAVGASRLARSLIGEGDWVDCTTYLPDEQCEKEEKQNEEENERQWEIHNKKLVEIGIDTNALYSIAYGLENIR